MAEICAGLLKRKQDPLPTAAGTRRVRPDITRRLRRRRDASCKARADTSPPAASDAFLSVVRGLPRRLCTFRGYPGAGGQR